MPERFALLPIVVLAFACTKQGSRVTAAHPLDARNAVDTAPTARDSDEPRCGYLGKDGRWAIPRRFDSVGEFSTGLARVRANHKVGFIDTQGRYAIAAIFDEAKRFHEDLAAACVNDKGWGFIDRKGSWVIPPAFAFADSFAEGLAVVKRVPDEKDACFVQAGREVPEGSECESGLADDGDPEAPGPYFLLDRTGKTVHAKGYHCITRMFEGLAAARLKEKWGYLDRTGKEVISPRFGRAKPFGQGLAAVWMAERKRGQDEDGLGGGKWGFINRTGRFVIYPRYQATEVGVFSDGFIAMEGVPVKMLLGSEAGRACAHDQMAADGFGPNDFKEYKEAEASCGVYLDRKGVVRVASPYCGFDDAPGGYRSFREFSGGFAEVVMDAPMRIKPFFCAPGLMGTVSTFIDRKGQFVPVRGVLRARAGEDPMPVCAPLQAAHETDAFILDE